MKTNFLLLVFENPRKSWSIIILMIFSAFSYKNIFQQTEIRDNLPEINLVEVLNSYDKILADPTPEKTDLYLTVSKMFDNFKIDYLKHYENYALVLKSALILEESRVSFRFYPSKHYLSDGDKDKVYKLGNLAVDFSRNLNLIEKSRRESLVDCSTPTWFSFSSHKEGTQKFVTSYIYPLFEFQKHDMYIGVPKEIEKVVKLWILLRYFQISNFICSLLYLCEAIFVFSLHTLDPKYYFKFKLFNLAILFKLISLYSVSVILIFLSFVVTIIMSNSKLNERADYNASYNFVQIIWLLIIGYFSKNWIYELYSENHSNEKGSFANNDLKFLKPLGNHTLKKQFKSILKVANNDKKVNDNSHETEEISIIAENGTLMSTNPLGVSKLSESEENQSNQLTKEPDLNKSSLKLYYSYHAASSESNSAMSSESLLNSNDPFINGKLINMVSSNNSTPFELSSATNNRLSSSSPVNKYSPTSKNEISIRSPINRDAFYQHSGISVNHISPYNHSLNHSITTIPNETVNAFPIPNKLINSKIKPNNLYCKGEKNTASNSLEPIIYKRSAEIEPKTKNLQNTNTQTNSVSEACRINQNLLPSIIIPSNENESNTDKTLKPDLEYTSNLCISDSTSYNE